MKRKRLSTCEILLLRAASHQGVAVEFVDEHGLMIFRKNKREIFVNRSLPDLNGSVAYRIANNKMNIKTVLKKMGLPVPYGVKVGNVKTVLDMLEKKTISYPLVVKPIDGAMGDAVSVDISREDWLCKAIDEVRKYNRRNKGKPGSVLIEKYIPGNDYRLLVLDGRVLTVMRREPAYVIGDGQKTIGQLIDDYNDQPDIDKDKPLCPIVRDFELERHLRRAKVSYETVPAKGQKISLRKNANVSTGGRSFECTDKTHPKYLEMAIRVAKAFHLRFCAVDLIAPRIDRYEKFALIEINPAPGFDIHEYPYRGRPYPVAEKLVEAMFKGA